MNFLAPLLLYDCQCIMYRKEKIILNRFIFWVFLSDGNVTPICILDVLASQWYGAKLLLLP